MRILFIHEGFGQFQTLHGYLNSEGRANSWFMCSKGVYEANRDKVPNVVPFDVVAENPKTYFYTRSLEARVQRSFLIRKSIRSLLEKTGIDLIVAHGSGGFPLHLYGEFDIPVVTYVEFPSFTSHGQDPKYPQPEYARYRDKIFEMASYHQVIRSELVVVPSAYARDMFPAYLHEKIVVQMEGFDIKRSVSRFAKEPGFTYVGFSSRDLSSAKGFEQFILIAKRILRVRPRVKFVFCGSPKTLYSYEGEFLRRAFPDGEAPESFMRYLLEREGISLQPGGSFQHLDLIPYNDFADFVEAMDFFIYPLQFGSANWGLFELLFRGRIVLSSDRCFVPEVIRHNENGLLCKYDDMDSWVRYAVDIIDHPEKYRRIGDEAFRDAHARFHIRNVAPRYLRIFEAAVHRYRLHG